MEICPQLTHAKEARMNADTQVFRRSMALSSIYTLDIMPSPYLFINFHLVLFYMCWNNLAWFYTILPISINPEQIKLYDLNIKLSLYTIETKQIHLNHAIKIKEMEINTALNDNKHNSTDICSTFHYRASYCMKLECV